MVDAQRRLTRQQPLGDSGSPRLRLQAGGDVVVQSRCGAHIETLNLTHLAVHLDGAPTMNIRSLLAAVPLTLAPAVVHAELDCIVPTREEGFEANRLGAENLRRAARAAAAVVQKNAVFMAGNKPVRVRTSISYYGLDWLSASVITTAYNQKAWLAGGCRISPYADRGGGLSDGQIAIYINDPGSLLGGQLGDAELRASGAPLQQGSISGHPIYAAGGNPENPRALLSEGGYRPWVPVTVAEMLAWRERELATQEADYARAQQRAGNGFDETKIEQMYQDMRKVDAAGAEKARAQMLASLQKMRADSARQSASTTQAMTKRRSAFDAYRASFTPAQLSGPGFISGTTTPQGVPRVDDPAGKALAKIDPGYGRRDPKRVHIITVALAPQPKTDPEYAWQQASYEALDFSALAALLAE